VICTSGSGLNPSNWVHQRHQPKSLSARSALATEGHVVCAADYVVRLLTSRRIPYALMRSLFLRMRGSPRETADVDLVMAANMLQLRTALEGNPR
jgi:hypothetical protein